MADRYYHKVHRVEVLNPTLPDPDIVVLPPSNPFWSPLPDGHELTYDGAGLPNGTQVIPVTPEAQLTQALRGAGITTGTVVRALYLRRRGIRDPLRDLNDAIDLIATDLSLTTEEVVNGLGG